MIRRLAGVTRGGAPFDDTVIAINLTQLIWEPGPRDQAVVDLFAAIRSLVDARSLPS